MWQFDPVSLRLFIAACEEGSITAAAAREFIAPSAVSKRISDIESAFATALLMRSKKGVAPTPAGQALLRHARKFMRDIERLQGELSEYAEGARGHVRVLANVSSLMEFLPEELARFLADNEHIQVDVEERFSSGVVSGIEEGHADIGICRKSMAEGDLEFYPYRTDHLSVVVNNRHPLAGRESISFVDTLDFHHLNISAFSTLGTQMQKLACAAGKDLQYRTCVSSFDAALRLVGAGMVLAIFPREAVARYVELFGLRVIPLTDEWVTGEFVVCVRDSTSLSLSARRLLDHLLAAPASV
jgi:DNA-binding transcriptional LysR family regulator